MQKFALFLRGVNVNGIKVESQALKRCLEELGLAAVQTYLQTGNVTLTTAQPASTSQALIEQALSLQFGYEAHVLLYRHEDLADLVQNFPFEVPGPDFHRYAVLVADPAILTELVELGQQNGQTVEQIAGGHRVVYWLVSKGQTLDSPFGKLLSRAKYRTAVTTRNLNTLERML